MKEKDENIENLFGNLKNGQPFRVPEGYFETFAERLQVRIEEEELPTKKRTLYFYLKPALSMAASIALVMLLVYVPIKKFFPSTQGYLTQQKSTIDSVDKVGVLPVPVDLFSYFSESQFVSAVADMKVIDSETISPDSLGDYIADNYTDLDIIANN